MKKHWDVVIIGGGLAGLVAANFLAQSHLSVLVLEKGKVVGGRAKTDRINNQLFNIGPHALYKKGKAKHILEQLGIILQGKSPKLDGSICPSYRKSNAFIFRTPPSNLLLTIQYLNDSNTAHISL